MRRCSALRCLILFLLVSTGLHDSMASPPPVENALPENLPFFSTFSICALDPETEQRVDANLRSRGCRSLIIAHRLSTIRDADELIVLERGRVVQRGAHEELLTQEGLYRELITTG